MLKQVNALLQNGQFVEALSALDPHLNENPEDPIGLFLLGQIMLETGKPAIAYTIYRRVTELEPRRVEGWINFGKAAGDLNRWDEEERYFRKALKLDRNNPITLLNLSGNGMHQKDPDKTLHWAKECLKHGESRDAHHNMGFAYLMKGDFQRGWKEYAYGMDTAPSRMVRNYTGEPQWQGESGTVVIYGEQGLGDQIALATCVPDAKQDADIILDVHHKLEGLFRRSFGVETHGTYRSDDISWARKVDYSISLSGINTMYRDHVSKFTGEPFLVADPQRRVQWRALLDTLGDKPKVGIAWTGGRHFTQKSERSFDLEALAPILMHDVHWISLEYTDKGAEIAAFEVNSGIKVYDWSWGTQTQDYDDTAALVAELDLVISVPTSVVHLAGGLGVPCWCLVPERPSWMFGLKGRAMPFYGSVELFRRNENGLVEIQERLYELRCDSASGAGTRRAIQKGYRINSDSHPQQRAI